MPSLPRTDDITSSNDLWTLLLLPLPRIQCGIQLEMLSLQTIAEGAGSNPFQAGLINHRKVPLNLLSFLFADT
jgi:hypothetical protein